MASISQTIPNYSLGMSKQPYHRMIPGQLTEIQNCTPDLTRGLPKRTGTRRIGRDPLSNVQANGTFFHYYRDENEGSYIGQVAPDGKVRMWSCLDGTEKNVWYSTDNAAYSSSNKAHKSITSYLGQQGVSSIAVTNGGSGYTSVPTVTITNTSGSTGSDATAVAVLTGGAVSSVVITNRGKNYSAGATVAFSGGGGSNAAATATVPSTAPKQNIQALTINDTTFLTNRTQVVSSKIGVNATYTRNKFKSLPMSAVNTTGNWLTINDHGFSTGDKVIYIEGGGTALAPLVNGTAYYVIKIDSNWFRLATTLANANANTWITLTGTGNDTQYLEYGFGIITVSRTDHGLTTDDSVNMTFTADDAGAKPDDGVYSITSITDDNTFTLTDPTITGMGLIDDLGVVTCTYDNSTPGTPDRYYAYIDLLRTENGRQYALNIYNDDSVSSSINIATRLKISSNTQDSSGGTGHCPGIGTQVFSVTAASSYSGTNIVSVKNSSGTDLTSGRNNLIFRITALGQQGSNPSGNFDDQNISANEYICSYNNRVELLHGGEGWEVGDKVVVQLDQAKTAYNFEIRIEKIETSVIKANIKAVRPEPTPFDADTAVTADSILGGITSEIGNSLTYTIIGNGLYISSTSSFNIQVPDKDLIRVMQSEINDVSELPNQCKHGYIVKVTNNREADEDDYYLKFVGENNKDGPGSWTECPKPGIVKGLDNRTMPHIIQRQADGDFLLKANTWTDREVGDDVTNPMPTFADGSSKINKVLFFRNRLAFLSGENVILSRPGELAVPSFFAKTALAVSAIDPIDISSSSTYPSDLFDGIEIPAGLVVFSTNQQFLLSADAEILNPDTAKFRSISHYNYDKNIPPISLGTTIGYIDNTGLSCRFMEMQQVQREQEPIVSETSKVVQGLMNSNINHVINSPENGIVLMTETDSSDSSSGSTFYGFKYQDFGERKQAAWFTWKFTGGDNGKKRYSFCIDDSLYILNGDNFLTKYFFVDNTSENTPVQPLTYNTQDFYGSDSRLYLDNWVPVTGGVYDSTTEKTTFTHGTGTCDFDWSSNVTETDIRRWVAVGFSSIGRSSSGAVVTNQKGYDLIQGLEDLNKGTSFKVTGDWSNATIYVGITYGLTLQFPQIYYTQQQGEQIKVDKGDYLVIHRLHFYTNENSTAEVGIWVQDKGTAKYEQSARRANNYFVEQIPNEEFGEFTTPVYEKNNRVWIDIRQWEYDSENSAGNFNLQSMTWEGDYSPKNYRKL